MKIDVRNVRNWGVGAKLSLTLVPMVGIFIAILVASVGHILANMIESRGDAEVSKKTQLIVDLVQATDKDLRSRTTALSKVFENELKGEWDLPGSTVDIGDKQTPALTLNGRVVNLHYEIPDRFTATTGAVATLFAKSGEDFVRVTTSLKNDKNERAVGTQLDHAHPAYKRMLEGGEFTGMATLFGRQYMTHYAPLKNTAGTVVGILFVGLDFTDYMVTLKSTIRNMKIGTSGYFYVLDARPGPSLGTLLVHPASEGKSILEAKDPTGHFFVKEILERKNGNIRYPWINTALGETHSRDKLVSFRHLESWNWIVAGGTYVDEYTAEVSSIRNIFSLLGVGVVLATAGVLYWRVRRLISGPLVEVQQAAARIAQGDLTVQLRKHHNDEIGHIVDAMNSIGAGLTKVVDSVRMGSQSVANASAEIAQSNQDLSNRTEQQASALQNTTANMSSLSHTLSDNVDNAKQANQLTRSASEVALRGGEVMEQVISTMKDINESSSRIADIIGVIDGIAFQTNILALNAAVEAARAGEQGRGFAVVASEVRSLAGRSAEAAKEIKSLITASVERVEQGTSLVGQAGNTMQEVVDSISRVNDIMSAISVSSAEQSTGVGEVSEAVTQIDQTTQQNAALVEQMAAAAVSLKSQARELVDTVSVFKTH